MARSSPRDCVAERRDVTPDHALIAAAQKHAGAFVHDVSNRITVYELACTMLAERCTAEQRASYARIVCNSEHWLRAFVIRQRLNLPCRTLPSSE